MDFEDFIFPFCVLFERRTKALKKLGPTPHAPGAEAVQRQLSVRLPCAFSPPARYSRGQFNSCAVLWFEWWIFVKHRSHLKATTKEGGLRQHLRVCGDVDRDCVSEGASVCVHTYMDTYVYTYIHTYVCTYMRRCGWRLCVRWCVSTYEYT